MKGELSAQANRDARVMAAIYRNEIACVYAEVDDVFPATAAKFFWATSDNATSENTSLFNFDIEIRSKLG